MSDTKPNLIRELFERNKRDLMTYLSRRVGRDDASDLLQETFVRALRYRNFGAVADPPAFLQRIAVNLMTDHARRRRTEAKHLAYESFLDDYPANDAPADERVDHDRRRRQLAAAIDELPARCRQVFELSAFEDVPISEIARRLGISERMARQHLSLAMRRCWAALA